MPDPKDLAALRSRTATCGRPIPNSCCHIRKTEPLDVVLDGFGGWVTGRKRYQTKERGVLPHFELTSDDRIKVNPLAYFSDADVNAYKLKHGLPEHPLFAKGYKSIGCAPCTTIVAEGEDPRAGRWRGLNKKECGIHFDFNGAIAKPMAAAGAEPVQGRRLHRRSVPRLGRGRRPGDGALHPRPAAGVPRQPRGGAGQPASARACWSRRATRSRTWRTISAASPRSPSTFPAFTDGRGYSSARLLVERFGYKGELRAVGDVLADQIPLMRRCGITAFVVKHEPTRKALENGELATVNIFYQPVGHHRSAGRHPSVPAPRAGNGVT